MTALTSVMMIASAIMVVAGLSGCRRGTGVAADPEWWRLEADRIELAHKVELQRLRLEKMESRGGGHAEQEALLARSVPAGERLAERAAVLRDEIEELSQRLVAARDGWRRERREAAVGRSFAEFRGAGGRVYREVVVTRVTDIGIEFRHATGIARLAAADLSAGQRDSFGLEEESALAALAEERTAAEAYGSWVDQRVAADAARGEAMEPVAEAAGPLLADASQGFRKSLRDEPRSFGRGSSWSFRYSRPRFYYGDCASDDYAAPVYRTAVQVPGCGIRNLRVPSANWSFTAGGGCGPLPRPITFPTCP